MVIVEEVVDGVVLLSGKILGQGTGPVSRNLFDGEELTGDD